MIGGRRRKARRCEAAATVVEFTQQIAASRFYFRKSASSLSWSEAALLTAMLANPHLYNPYKSPLETQRRRDAVLASLLDSQEISPQEYQRAVSLPCCAPAVQEKGAVKAIGQAER